MAKKVEEKRASLNIWKSLLCKVETCAGIIIEKIMKGRTRIKVEEIKIVVLYGNVNFFKKFFITAPNNQL
jgi:hypothetical protein